MFDFILNAYRQNRMPHAFLLMGKASAEKEALIGKIASLLLCVSPKSEGACGVCRGCQWFSQGVHPDHCVLGENEAILVENLRELHGFLEKTAHQSGYKVIIIHDVDAMSIYTANALLKNVEEPPERTVFLLTAQNIQKVLPTIRSRCVSIHLYDLSFKFSKTDQNFKEVLFWGTDSLFNQEAIFEKVTAETLETLYLFYHWVAEYCRYGSTKNTGYLSVTSEQPRMDAFLEILPVEKAITFLGSLVEAIESLSVTGLNKGLLWGSLIVQWQQLKERKI